MGEIGAVFPAEAISATELAGGGTGGLNCAGGASAADAGGRAEDTF